jgi:hypothetical protein
MRNFILLLTVVFGLQMHVGGFANPPLQESSIPASFCRDTAMPCPGGVRYAQTEITPTVLLLSRQDSDQPAAQTIYAVTMDDQHETLITLEDHFVDRLEGNWILLDDGSLGINLNSDRREVESVAVESSDGVLTDIQQILGDDFAPMFGPILVDDELFLMAGQDDPAVNLYMLRDDALMQLTDARAIFPQAAEPLLSASVAFVAMRPGHDGFLYRARVRDGEGIDHNALFWHDLSDSHPMPFFGKDPVWSPDGNSLAGSRFNDETTLYELWMIDVISGEARFIANACNPQFSPDGAWLAYDLHENAIWTAYTDCYASGQVEALNISSGERVLLSDGLPDFVTLIGWR